MSKMIILVASNGKNLELGQQLSELAGERKVETQMISLIDLKLPLYTPDEEENAIPKAAIRLAEELRSARCLVVIAPEYNGSLPPTLNNAIAWISRTGEDWRAAFNKKLAAIATHSGGGGLHVLMAMRQQLSFIGVNVLGRQIHTHHKKALDLESARAVVDQLIALTEKRVEC